MARRCTLQVVYAIGVAKPVSFFVDAEGCVGKGNLEIAAELQREFKLTPAGIIETLDLQWPIYYPTAG